MAAMSPRTRTVTALVLLGALFAGGPIIEPTAIITFSPGDFPSPCIISDSALFARSAPSAPFSLASDYHAGNTSSIVLGQCAAVETAVETSPWTAPIYSAITFLLLSCGIHCAVITMKRFVWVRALFARVHLTVRSAGPAFSLAYAALGAMGQAQSLVEIVPQWRHHLEPWTVYLAAFLILGQFLYQYRHLGTGRAIDALCQKIVGLESELFGERSRSASSLAYIASLEGIAERALARGSQLEIALFSQANQFEKKLNAQAQESKKRLDKEIYARSKLEIANLPVLESILKNKLARSQLDDVEQEQRLIGPEAWRGANTGSSPGKHAFRRFFDRLPEPKTPSSIPEGLPQPNKYSNIFGNLSEKSTSRVSSPTHSAHDSCAGEIIDEDKQEVDNTTEEKSESDEAADKNGDVPEESSGKSSHSDLGFMNPFKARCRGEDDDEENEDGDEEGSDDEEEECGDDESENGDDSRTGDSDPDAWIKHVPTSFFPNRPGGANTTLPKPNAEADALSVDDREKVQTLVAHGGASSITEEPTTPDLVTLTAAMEDDLEAYPANDQQKLPEADKQELTEADVTRVSNSAQSLLEELPAEICPVGGSADVVELETVRESKTPDESPQPEIIDQPVGPGHDINAEAMGITAVDNAETGMATEVGSVQGEVQIVFKDRQVEQMRHETEITATPVDGIPQDERLFTDEMDLEMEAQSQPTDEMDLELDSQSQPAENTALELEAQNQPTDGMDVELNGQSQPVESTDLELEAQSLLTDKMNFDVVVQNQHTHAMDFEIDVVPQQSEHDVQTEDQSMLDVAEDTISDLDLSCLDGTKDDEVLDDEGQSRGALESGNGCSYGNPAGDDASRENEVPRGSDHGVSAYENQSGEEIEWEDFHFYGRSDDEEEKSNAGYENQSGGAMNSGTEDVYGFADDDEMPADADISRMSQRIPTLATTSFNPALYAAPPRPVPTAPSFIPLLPGLWLSSSNKYTVEMPPMVSERTVVEQQIPTAAPEPPGAKLFDHNLLDPALYDDYINGGNTPTAVHPSPSANVFDFNLLDPSLRDVCVSGEDPNLHQQLPETEDLRNEKLWGVKPAHMATNATTSVMTGRNIAPLKKKQPINFKTQHILSQFNEPDPDDNNKGTRKKVSVDGYCFYQPHKNEEAFPCKRTFAKPGETKCCGDPTRYSSKGVVKAALKRDHENRIKASKHQLCVECHYEEECETDEITASIQDAFDKESESEETVAAGPTSTVEWNATKRKDWDEMNNPKTTTPSTARKILPLPKKHAAKPNNNSKEILMAPTHSHRPGVCFYRRNKDGRRHICVRTNNVGEFKCIGDSSRYDAMGTMIRSVDVQRAQVLQARGGKLCIECYLQECAQDEEVGGGGGWLRGRFKGGEEMKGSEGKRGLRYGRIE